MIYDVCHRTTIHYAGVVRLARFNLRLAPAPWPGQLVSNYRLVVDPHPASLREAEGPYLAHECHLLLREPIARLTIESRFRAEVLERPVGPLPPGPPLAELRAAALARRDLARTSPANYLFASPIARPDADIAAWAAAHIPPGCGVVAAGQALMQAIHAAFRFDASATRADTSPTDAFRLRQGVCQDFTHVMIVAARAQGIPAAYVSGYLRTLPPPGMPRLVGADAMHAWAALWCGDALGWVGFDPTNAVLAGTDHIFVAMGRDYSDVAPLDGVFHGGDGQSMGVSVDVLPLGEEAGLGTEAGQGEDSNAPAQRQIPGFQRQRQAPA